MSKVPRVAISSGRFSPCVVGLRNNEIPVATMQVLDYVNICKLECIFAKAPEMARIAMKECDFNQFLKFERAY